MTLLDAPVRTEPVPPTPPPKPPLWERVSPEAAITFVVVAACAIFTFVELEPSNIFSNSTPTGGDMGAHVWLPWFVEHDLLPHFRITGWTMDWYAGFPALTYYFPLPMLGIVALNLVLPYNIAFKLVVVSGLIALPVVVWAFGRLARMPFPGPACMAAAMVPYLFSRTFTIYGGNIASTMAGEFSFSCSLALAFVLLGLTARGMATGRHRGLASVLLVCTAMCHVLPTMFAVVGIVVLTIMSWISRRDWTVWLWTLPVLVVGGLLSAFWSLAFELRLPYATNMGYQKIVTYTTTLFPSGLTWLFVLAGIGAIMSLARRRQVGTFLTIMTVLCIFAFRYSPQGRLWNARVLPFWFVCLYLLAGLAFCEAGILVAEWRRGWGDASRAGLVAVPVVTLLVAMVWVGYPLRILPGGTTTASGDYDWLGITSSDNSFVPGWVTWNFTGYQGTDKSRRTEYFAVINLMKSVGKTSGCGRAMWEYEPELNDMGTPDALMLLPYWTDNCIDSMEGLYYESSATTPYHFTNVSELSEQPSDPMRGISYASSPSATPPGETTTYFTEGIEHLQMFGVKYYMAISPQTQQLAAADPDLRLVAHTSNYPVDYTSTSGSGPSGIQQRHWNIYEVLDSTLVTPLQNQPVVMNGVSTAGIAWQNASLAWYDDPSRWSVYETASGPKAWDRVSAADTNPPQTPLPPVTVTDIKVGQESMSFNVDHTGVPVLVNTSYYPNWKVSGGKGPYRVTPNLMVVIPTSTHVTMNYGYTTLDEVGYGMSFLGLLGVVALWRLGPVEYAASRLRGRHAQVAAPPPPDLLPDGGLSDPWTRLGIELSETAGADWPSSPSNFAGWLDPSGQHLPTATDADSQGAQPPPAPAWATALAPPPELPPLDLPGSLEPAEPPAPVVEPESSVGEPAPPIEEGLAQRTVADQTVAEPFVPEPFVEDSPVGASLADGSEVQESEVQESEVHDAHPEPSGGGDTGALPALDEPAPTPAEGSASETVSGSVDTPEAPSTGSLSDSTAEPTGAAPPEAEPSVAHKWGIPGILPDRTFPSGFLGRRKGRRH